MKKLLVVLSILTIAFAGSAFAQDAPWQNNAGVYLADGSHAADAAAGSTLDLHLILSNLTADSVAGFELKLVAFGPLFVMESSVVFPTQVINVGSRPGEYIVGFDVPMPADGSFEVMTFSAIVTDAAVPAGLLIQSVYFPSLPGVPNFLVDGGTGELIELRQSTGGADDPVFVVNTQDIPVATESTSFDSLKSLYR